MGEQFVRVECYAGYKGDERPLRLYLGEKAIDVVEMEDRWYSPGATFFRVKVSGGDRYVLRHEEAQDVWSLIGYRAAVAGQFPIIRRNRKGR
jgi:hypothetical protein